MRKTEAGRDGTHGADGRATLCEHGQAREDALDALDTVRELLDVAGEFLAESERRRVLKVGAADLDNVLELQLLGVHGRVELDEGGEEGVGDFDDGRDVHRGGEAAQGAI